MTDMGLGLRSFSCQRMKTFLHSLIRDSFTKKWTTNFFNSRVSFLNDGNVQVLAFKCLGCKNNDTLRQRSLTNSPFTDPIHSYTSLATFTHAPHLEKPTKILGNAPVDSSWRRRLPGWHSKDRHVSLDRKRGMTFLGIKSALFTHFSRRVLHFSTIPPCTDWSKAGDSDWKNLWNQPFPESFRPPLKQTTNHCCGYRGFFGWNFLQISRTNLHLKWSFDKANLAHFGFFFRCENFRTFLDFPYMKIKTSQWLNQPSEK